jgi:hypothetical protein
VITSVDQRKRLLAASFGPVSSVLALEELKMGVKTESDTDERRCLYSVGVANRHHSRVPTVVDKSIDTLVIFLVIGKYLVDRIHVCSNRTAILLRGLRTDRDGNSDRLNRDTMC